MPQQKQQTAKKVIKSGLIKDAGILFGILLLIFEGLWFRRFFAGMIEWYKMPLPDYETVIEGIHFVRLIVCLICLAGFFKPLRAFWYVFKYAAFLYQSVIVAFTTVYWVRYGYTPGVGIADVCMILSGIPLLIAFFLMIVKKNGISRVVLSMIILLDLVFYLLGYWFYQDIAVFNFFYPYHGFYLKSLVAALFITFICCFGNQGENDG